MFASPSILFGISLIIILVYVILNYTRKAVLDRMWVLKPLMHVSVVMIIASAAGMIGFSDIDSDIRSDIRGMMSESVLLTDYFFTGLDDQYLQDPMKIPAIRKELKENPEFPEDVQQTISAYISKIENEQVRQIFEKRQNALFADLNKFLSGDWPSVLISPERDLRNVMTNLYIYLEGYKPEAMYKDGELTVSMVNRSLTSVGIISDPEMILQPSRLEEMGIDSELSAYGFFMRAYRIIFFVMLLYLVFSLVYTWYKCRMGYEEKSVTEEVSHQVSESTGKGIMVIGAVYFLLHGLLLMTLATTFFYIDLLIVVGWLIMRVWMPVISSHSMVKALFNACLILTLLLGIKTFGFGDIEDTVQSKFIDIRSSSPYLTDFFLTGRPSEYRDINPAEMKEMDPKDIERRTATIHSYLRAIQEEMADNPETVQEIRELIREYATQITVRQVEVKFDSLLNVNWDYEKFQSDYRALEDPNKVILPNYGIYSVPFMFNNLYIHINDTESLPPHQLLTSPEDFMLMIWLGDTDLENDLFVFGEYLRVVEIIFWILFIYILLTVYSLAYGAGHAQADGKHPLVHRIAGGVLLILALISPMILLPSVLPAVSFGVQMLILLLTAVVIAIGFFVVRMMNTDESDSIGKRVIGYVVLILFAFLPGYLMYAMQPEKNAISFTYITMLVVAILSWHGFTQWAGSRRT